MTENRRYFNIFKQSFHIKHHLQLQVTWFTAVLATFQVSIFSSFFILQVLLNQIHFIFTAKQQLLSCFLANISTATKNKRIMFYQKIFILKCLENNGVLQWKIDSDQTDCHRFDSRCFGNCGADRKPEK